jgi:hypothetical protein
MITGTGRQSGLLDLGMEGLDLLPGDLIQSHVTKD